MVDGFFNLGMVLGAVFIFLIVFPGWFRLSMSGDIAGEYSLIGSFYLGLGLIGVVFLKDQKRGKIRLEILGLPLFSKTLVGRIKGPKEKKKEPKWAKIPHQGKFIWQRRSKFFRYFRYLGKCFYLGHLIGYIRFGHSNPATTGEIYGYLCILCQRWHKRVTFHPQAVFFEPCFQGKFAGRVFFVPILIFVMLLTGVLDLGWQYRKFNLLTAK